MGRGGQKSQVVGEGKKTKLGETRVCKSLKDLPTEQLKKKAQQWGLPELAEREALLRQLVSSVHNTRSEKPYYQYQEFIIMTSHIMPWSCFFWFLVGTIW